MLYQALLLNKANPNNKQLLSITNFDSLTSNPDFTRVEPMEGKTSISIEQVHTLIATLSQKPFSHDHKAVLISPADALTLPAQQALLKTLEEPPANTLLLLATDRPHALLPTILSRCTVIKLKNNGNDESVETLHRILSLSKDTASQNDANKKTSKQENMLQTPLSISQAIKIAGEKGKTKEEAIQFVNQLLEQSRTTQYSTFHTNLQKECIKALRLLSANVNTKLVLENLLFQIVKNYE